MPASSQPVPYLEFKAELEQILRHKWLLSEKEDRDIGFERALNDWALNHRAEWRRHRNKEARPRSGSKG